MQQQEEAAHSLHPLQVGPQPLNTPEELRAIRQAMGRGRTRSLPLMCRVGKIRWVSGRIINRRVLEWSRCPRPRKCSLNSR